MSHACVMPASYDNRLVGHFGLPGWHDGNGGLKLRAEAMAGANWMLTPWRSLTLVHATQQPVCLPAMAFVSRRTVAGRTSLDLARRVPLHGPSTGKFEIVGEWEEWIDDPLQPSPLRKAHRAAARRDPLGENHVNVFTLALRRQTECRWAGHRLIDTGDKRLRGNRHEFGDTRFRLVRYHVRATTRFREYLPPALFAQRGTDHAGRTGGGGNERRCSAPTTTPARR